LRAEIFEMPDPGENEPRTGAPDQQSGEPERPQSRPHHQSRPQPARQDDELRRTLSDLQERVEDLSDRLTEVQDTHDDDVTALEADIKETLDTLTDLESSVDNLVGHSELESLAVSLEEELSRIEESTTELGGRLSQVEESQSQTTAELTDLADGQADLEARLEQEFDSIERLFEHLIDKTDNLEYRLEATSDTHREDMNSVEELLEEREQLVTLMRQAQQKDISRAVCDNCETSVDLGMLETPRCPSCDRTYRNLVEGGWLPFDKPKLETESIQSRSEGLNDGSPDPTELLESPPSDGPRT
jgi:predicted  nucleic acid-binding Zn-ribbon protein